MTNRPWKLILLLTAIFLAGGVTGGLLMAEFGRKLMPVRPRLEQLTPMHLRKLTDRLNLQPDQVEVLRPIVRRNLEELGRLRSACLADSRVVYERMQREVAEKLTPEQRDKFEELNRQMRERARKFMPKRPGRPEAQGERKPGPDSPPKEEGK